MNKRMALYTKIFFEILNFSMEISMTKIEIAKKAMEIERRLKASLAIQKNTTGRKTL